MPRLCPRGGGGPGVSNDWCIMKKKDEIISAFEGGFFTDKRKKMKQATFPDFDKALSEWFRKF